MKWIRIGKRIGPEGTTIVYGCYRANLTIESRKRHIPHANGVGTWDHTTYFVVADGEDLKELYSLADAKAWAEGYAEKSGAAAMQARRPRQNKGGRYNHE